MRIAVDLHGIQSEGSRSRGIGRYSLEIIKNIICDFPNHEIILIANASLSDLKQELNSYLNYKNVTYIKWFAPCPFHYVSGNTAKRKIAKYLKSFTYGCVKADIILITSFFEGYADNCLVEFDRDFIKIPIVSIFYDLIPLINHDLYLKDNPDFKKFYFSKLTQINKLDGLLAISDSSAKEANKYLTLQSNKVFNISSACNENIFNKDQVHNSLDLCTSILREYPELANPTTSFSANKWNLDVVKGMAKYFFQSVEQERGENRRLYVLNDNNEIEVFYEIALAILIKVVSAEARKHVHRHQFHRHPDHRHRPRRWTLRQAHPRPRLCQSQSRSDLHQVPLIEPPRLRSDCLLQTLCLALV